MRIAGTRIAAAVFLAAAILGADELAAQSEPGPTTSILFEWDHTGVTITDGRISLTNDLGYRIDLNQAYIVNLSVELVPCEKWSALAVPEKRSVLYDLVFGRPAFAGHSRFRSPSRLQHSTAEPLTGSTIWSLGTVTPPDVAYCQAHYLIGRAVAVTNNLPTSPDLRNLSLYLAGRFETPGDPVPRRFEIKTAEASGQIVKLTGPSGQPFSRKLPSGASVLVRRRLAPLFDGINFSNYPSPETARAVLRNLVRSITATVQEP